MSFLTGKQPSPPPVPAPPALPKETDAEVRSAAQRERELLKRRKGHRANLLTPGGGLTGESTLLKSRFGE